MQNCGFTCTHVRAHTSMRAQWMHTRTETQIYTHTFTLTRICICVHTQKAYSTRNKGNNLLDRNVEFNVNN